MTSPWDTATASMCGVIVVHSSDSEDSYDDDQSLNSDEESYKEYQSEWRRVQGFRVVPQYLHYGRARPDGPWLGDQHKGPFYEIFDDPPPITQYWMQVFMMMKGFRMNGVFPYINLDKRMRKTNDDGTPMIYVNIRCTDVTVADQIRFTPHLRKGKNSGFHGHITLAHVYLNGLNTDQRGELQGLLWEIIGGPYCDDLLEALSQVNFKFDWMKWISDGLIEISDDDLYDLLAKIITRTAQRLCDHKDVMGTDNLFAIKSRFHVGRHPRHYRLEADTYLNRRREAIMEWF